MSDLIKRQDAIKAVSMQIDIDALYNVPSAQQWIPCSERLPENEGRYLVTCSKIGAWVVDWNIWYTIPKPSWLWDQGVTAWMPLPAPYKEGEVES